MGKDTPSLTEVIESVLERRLLDLHTSIPGIIQSYDPNNKTVDVRPAIKRKFIEDGSEQELNLITDVPVAFLQTNSFIFSVPLQKGDEVLLIFSERSMDKWLRDGKIVNPEDPRKFDLSDAIAVPILKPIGTGKKADSSNALIEHGAASLKMSQKGFSFSNDSSELLASLSSLLSKLIADWTIINGVVFGSPPLPPGIDTGGYSSIKGDIDSLKL